MDANEVVNKYVTGEMPPPNEFLEYLIKGVQEAQKNFETLDKQVRQARTQIAEMEKEAYRVQGQITKYADDIWSWHQKAEREMQGENIPKPGELAESLEKARSKNAKPQVVKVDDTVAAEITKRNGKNKSEAQA